MADFFVSTRKMQKENYRETAIEVFVGVLSEKLIRDLMSKKDVQDRFLYFAIFSLWIFVNIFIAMNKTNNTLYLIIYSFVMHFAN